MSYHSLTLLLNVELTRLSSILQGNLHHLMFPFRRLVVLDLDLVFEVNIDDLYREFESMERDRLVDFISVGRNFPNVISMYVMAVLKKNRTHNRLELRGSFISNSSWLLLI